MRVFSTEHHVVHKLSFCLLYAVFEDYMVCPGESICFLQGTCANSFANSCFSQLFKGKFFVCQGEDTRNITNKSDCAEASYKWVRHKYNFDNLGQVLMEW